jgi:DNA-binding MurR/RpiR family transcriptional regulator
MRKKRDGNTLAEIALELRVSKATVYRLARANAGYMDGKHQVVTQTMPLLTGASRGGSQNSGISRSRPSDSYLEAELSSNSGEGIVG